MSPEVSLGKVKVNNVSPGSKRSVFFFTLFYYQWYYILVRPCFYDATISVSPRPCRFPLSPTSSGGGSGLRIARSEAGTESESESESERWLKKYWWRTEKPKRRNFSEARAFLSAFRRLPGKGVGERQLPELQKHRCWLGCSRWSLMECRQRRNNWFKIDGSYI